MDQNPVNAPTDAELIERVKKARNAQDADLRRAGAEAMKVVFDRYKAFILGLLVRLRKNLGFEQVITWEDLEELLQDVFKDVWTTADRIDLASFDLTMLLATMARRKLYSRLRHRNVVDEAEEVAADLQQDLDVVTPFDGAVGAELRSRIREVGNAIVNDALDRLILDNWLAEAPVPWKDLATSAKIPANRLYKRRERLSARLQVEMESRGYLEPIHPKTSNEGGGESTCLTDDLSPSAGDTTDTLDEV